METQCSKSCIDGVFALFSGDTSCAAITVAVAAFVLGLIVAWLLGKLFCKSRGDVAAGSADDGECVIIVFAHDVSRLAPDGLDKGVGKDFPVCCGKRNASDARLRHEKAVCGVVVECAGQ